MILHLRNNPVLIPPLLAPTVDMRGRRNKEGAIGIVGIDELAFDGAGGARRDGVSGFLVGYCPGEGCVLAGDINFRAVDGVGEGGVLRHLLDD